MANPHPNYKLLLTGGRGGLGTAFPNDAYRLTTRLESSISNWTEELRRAKDDHRACVIHMAAMTLVDDCEKKPQECFHMNVDFAIKVFEACAQARIERFVFVSTSHVYAASSKPVTTGSRLGARSMYPRSKLLAETLLASAASEIPDAPKLSIARVFSLIGPGMKGGFLYPHLVTRAKSQDATPIMGYHNVRDFVTTDFASKRLMALARSHEFPRLANISTGQGLSVGDLARQVYAEHGADPNMVTPAEVRASDNQFQVGVPTEFR